MSGGVLWVLKFLNNHNAKAEASDQQLQTNDFSLVEIHIPAAWVVVKAKTRV
jgi:hypothetical protein